MLKQITIIAKNKLITTSDNICTHRCASLEQRCVFSWCLHCCAIVLLYCVFCTIKYGYFCMLSNFPSGRRLDLGWPWDEIDWFICLFAIFVHHGLSACLGLCSQPVTVSDSQCLSLSHSQEKVKFYYVMFKLFGCRHAIKMYKQQTCETIKELNYIFLVFVLTFCAFGSYSLLTFLFAFCFDFLAFMLQNCDM